MKPFFISLIFFITLFLWMSSSVAQNGHPQKKLAFSNDKYIYTDFIDYNSLGNITKFTRVDTTNSKVTALEYYKYDDLQRLDSIVKMDFYVAPVDTAFLTTYFYDQGLISTITKDSIIDSSFSLIAKRWKVYSVIRNYYDSDGKLTFKYSKDINDLIYNATKVSYVYQDTLLSAYVTSTKSSTDSAWTVTETNTIQYTGENGSNITTVYQGKEKIKTILQEYDSSGRLVKKQQDNNSESIGWHTFETSRYEFDDKGNLVKSFYKNYDLDYKFIYTDFFEVPVTGLQPYMLTEVSVFPNPVIDEVNITGNNNADFKSVKIYNLNGCLVSQLELHKTSIPFQQILPGTYLLEIDTSVGKKTIRIVKE